MQDILFHIQHTSAGLQKFLYSNGSHQSFVVQHILNMRGSCEPSLQAHPRRVVSRESRFYFVSLRRGGGAAVKVDLEHRDRAPRAQNGSLSFKTRPAARQLQILRRLLSRCLHKLAQKNYKPTTVPGIISRRCGWDWNWWITGALNCGAGE